MSTLRKACTKCTKSKRRCIIQKPKCTRCVQKNLECVYDLEPLNTSPTEAEKAIAFGFNLSDYEALGVCIIRTLKARASATDPAICNTGHENAVEIVRLGFNIVPEFIKAGAPSTFVHPMLQLHKSCDHFTSIMEGDVKGICSKSFRHLIQIDITVMSINEILPALQALLVHLAASAFSPFSIEQVEAEKALDSVFVWTQTLLERVDAGVPKSQSPWQDWLLGESIRRTVFMAYVLNLSVVSYKYGYCSNWLFMESLPFDSRPGLWMAQSPQAWIAAANAKSGEEVGERLNSYHEFAEAFHGRVPDFSGDNFLTLVVLAHNGLSGN